MKTEAWLGAVHFAIGKTFQLRTSLGEVVDYSEIKTEDSGLFYGIIGEVANECIQFIIDHGVKNSEDITLQLSREIAGDMEDVENLGLSYDANYVYLTIDHQQMQGLQFMIDLMFLYDGCIDVVSAIHMVEKYITWEVK